MNSYKLAYKFECSPIPYYSAITNLDSFKKEVDKVEHQLEIIQ